MITANHANGVLTIAGAVDSQISFGIVAISHSDTAASVFVSSDDTDYSVTLTGDPAPYTVLDASGLIFASIEFDGNNGDTNPVVVTGTRMDDYFFTQNTGSNTFNGFKGNDHMRGYFGNDVLNGGRGADTITANAGDDTVSGGRGNDYLEGGSGDDVLQFSGNFADYTITLLNEEYQIRDNVGTDGFDTFDGFETLEFADQSVDIFPFASPIEGEVIGDTLVLGGSATLQSDTELVRVVLNNGTVRVNDNGSPSVRREYTQGSETLTDFDGRGFGGAGIELVWEAYEQGLIRGSAQSDSIRIFYDDSFSGPAPTQVITAKNGDDTVFSGMGDDMVTGGRGDDVLNGWTGNDTAYFSGDFSEYDLQADEGFYTITHLNGGQDGGDILANFEHAVFADQTVQLATLASDIEVEVVGTKLTVSGAVNGGAQGVVRFQQGFDDGGYVITEEFVVANLVAAAANFVPLTKIDFGGLELGGANVREVGSSGLLAIEILGSNQNDVLDTFGINDAVLAGRDGDDELRGGTGENLLLGGKGDDTLKGSIGEDTLDGGKGNDTLDGSSGDDRLSGGNGNDEIEGGFGHDVISGGKGSDQVYAGYGDDVISGGKGDDWMEGEQGNDTLSGGRGDDTIDGGAGDDVVIFAYDLAEYNFTDLGETEFVATHFGGNQRDGVDVIEDVETLQFQDQTVIYDDLF